MSDVSHPSLDGAPRRLVLGNWKMNGTPATLSLLPAIAAAAREPGSPDVGIAVPYILIASASAIAPHLAIGAQDVHHAAAGPFTGGISADQVRACGASFAIVGHSETRGYGGDEGSTLRAKVRRAVDAGLSVVLCCGEPAAVRDAGGAIPYVLSQLDEMMPSDLEAASLIIAYEPCWAIGSGRSPSAQEIGEVHEEIRRWCRTRAEPGTFPIPVIYGGSVTPGSVTDLRLDGRVDGVLVGGASLDAASFIPIVRAFRSPGSASESRGPASRGETTSAPDESAEVPSQRPSMRARTSMLAVHPAADVEGASPPPFSNALSDAGHHLDSAVALLDAEALHVAAAYACAARDEIAAAAGNARATKGRPTGRPTI